MKEKLIRFNYYILDLEKDILFKNILYFLKLNIEDPSYTIDRLLKDIHLSRTQLHRKIKEKLGISTTEFIKIYKLKQSVDFLEQGFNSSETAYKVGFESPSYYTKCFRELFEFSPTNYQKKHAKSFLTPFQAIIKY